MHGSDEQRKSFLPRVLNGEQRLSISITEPGAGSDAKAISTSASKVDGGYVIRGQKVFTTGAGLPNTTLFVTAKMGDSGPPGMSVFLVPADRSGVSLKRLTTVGRHILGTYEVFLDDVIVAEDALLGLPGHGWSVLGDGLTLERLFSCAAYVGGFETVLEMTVDYVKNRRQFRLSNWRVSGDFASDRGYVCGSAGIANAHLRRCATDCPRTRCEDRCLVGQAVRYGEVPASHEPCHAGVRWLRLRSRLRLAPILEVRALRPLAPVVLRCSERSFAESWDCEHEYQ